MKDRWIASALTKFEKPLLRYVTRLLGNAERAREVVQETFLKLWEQNERELESHLAQWLFTVSRNRAIDVKRKEWRMKPLKEDSPAMVSEKATPVRLVELAQEGSQVLRLVAKLPESQQEVVRLKFQNDLSYQEIANITGHSVSNVGVLLHTALKTIRKELSLEMAAEKIGGAQ